MSPEQPHRGSSNLADSSPPHGAVPTERPSAARRSSVSQADLGFRKLELKTDLMGWPAQLPYPVTFLLPWSPWRWCQVGCPLTLRVISYCHNREGTHPPLTCLSNGAQITRPSSVPLTRKPRPPHLEVSPHTHTHTSLPVSKHPVPAPFLPWS